MPSLPSPSLSPARSAGTAVGKGGARQKSTRRAGWNTVVKLAGCGILGSTFLGGCTPISQRTFNPQAGMPPKVELDALPPRPVNTHHPFIEIMADTPEDAYAPAVKQAVHTALARKPNILFIVEAAAPMQPTPEQQAQTLTALTRNLAAPVGEKIIAAGAQPLQLQMQAVTDPDIKQGMVRINVR